MKSWHKQLETTNAIGNTANEISGIIRDLKEAGTINNTANTVVETANTTLTIIEIAKMFNKDNGASETTKDWKISRYTIQIILTQIKYLFVLESFIFNPPLAQTHSL